MRSLDLLIITPSSSVSICRILGRLTYFQKTVHYIARTDVELATYRYRGSVSLYYETQEPVSAIQLRKETFHIITH